MGCLCVCVCSIQHTPFLWNYHFLFLDLLTFAVGNLDRL